jgi:hypothetical protein
MDYIRLWRISSNRNCGTIQRIKDFMSLMKKARAAHRFFHQAEKDHIERLEINTKKYFPGTLGIPERHRDQIKEYYK